MRREEKTETGLSLDRRARKCGSRSDEQRNPGSSLAHRPADILACAGKRRAVANKFGIALKAHRVRARKSSLNYPLRGPSSNESKQIIHRDFPLRHSAEPALFSHR